MKRIYHIVRQILSGKRAINNNIKYLLVCSGVALVHLCFTISFAAAHFVPLAIYNIASTAFYFFHATVTNRKKQYMFIYISAVTEVLFHSSLATLLLGWDWGFMIFTIVIIPIAFYLAYTLPNHEGGIVSPLVCSTVVFLCFNLVHVICRHTTPYYEGKYPANMEIVFYYFNTMVAFLILVFFSILFALEIRYMQRRLEQENYTLEEVAKTDPLTHLLNRRSMNGYMDQVVKLRKTFCLMMADIDDFKKINDTYGHDCGDEVLIAVSDIISHCVREDDYVCRWGGEEILILVRTDSELAVQVAERIRQQIASKVITRKGKEVRVTITIGVSQYKTGMSIQSMIEEADQNLYKGKNNGKNQVIV